MMTKHLKLTKTKLPALLLALMLSLLGARLNAQMCGFVAGQGCSNTDYNNSFMNSTSNAATIEYDNFTSTYHSTIVRTGNGSFKGWGESMANNGTSNVLSPIDINSTNYPALGSATIYKVTGGSYETVSNVCQFIALASDGLYAWGAEGNVLDATITSSNTFQKITVNGKADGLPPGVSPSDVKMMTASEYVLAIVTCSGDAWILSTTAGIRGNGSTGSSTVWSRVTDTANNPLTNVIALRVQQFSAIALKSDNTLWTWGLYTYLGNNTAVSANTKATQMQFPAVGKTAKMIGITQSSNTFAAAYYVLMTDGNLYDLGDNYHNLGDWTITERTSWVQPRYTSASGPVMNDIKWISPNEHSNGNAGINILTNNSTLYAFGFNSFGMLGGGNNSPSFIQDPMIPQGFSSTDKILAVETGGHTTMAVKACSQNFYYVGHRINGSMGNGSSANFNEYTYTNATAPVEICGASAVTLSPTAGPFCVGSTQQLTASSTGGTYTVLSGSGTVDANGLVSFPSAGITAIQYTAPASCNNATATVYLAAGTLSSPVIATNQAVASGGDPAAFTVTTPAAFSVAGTTITYQWQSSTDNGTTWTNISGATSATYDPPSGITTTTQYRQVASAGTCTAYSNAVTVTVVSICGNVTSGTNLYGKSIYLFNWDALTFANGLQNGDSNTFTIGGLSITATFSNVVTSYGPAPNNYSTADYFETSDMQTWSGAKAAQLYQTTGTTEALYSYGDGSTCCPPVVGHTLSFTVNFTATYQGLPYSLNLLAIDAESTDTSGENLKWITNGGAWTFLESNGTGGTYTLSTTTNTNDTLLDTGTGSGVSIYYSPNATRLDVSLLQKGKQGLAFGLYVTDCRPFTESSCYKPAATTGTTLDTKHGVTILGRAGADNGNWPMVRKGAWTALEAKTKGFVVNRIATTALVNSIAHPVEGMMVYDEEADCLKVYTTTDNGTTFSWQCMSTQACPN